MPKMIQQNCQLPAPPEALFSAYLDPERHAAITGGSVSISPEPGSSFSAFDGTLSGKILAINPGRMIVQSWRAKHWGEEDVDSTLILTFYPDPAGGRIDLVHVNVADHDYEAVKQGWDTYYWTPWREYLKKDPQP